LSLIIQYSLIIKQANPRLAGDDLTFKSQRLSFRGNEKETKTVPIIAKEKVERNEWCTIAVRTVDIFGNDAWATIVLKLCR